MVDWMKPQEAANYLGIRLEDLPRIILENEIDVELDDDGVVLGLDPADLREPLFEQHRRKVGHRPDDVKQQEKAWKEHEEKEKKEKEARTVKRMKLAKRVRIPHE